MSPPDTSRDEELARQLGEELEEKKVVRFTASPVSEEDVVPVSGSVWTGVEREAESDRLGRLMRETEEAEKRKKEELEMWIFDLQNAIEERQEEQDAMEALTGELDAALQQEIDDLQAALNEELEDKAFDEEMKEMAEEEEREMEKKMKKMDRETELKEARSGKKPAVADSSEMLDPEELREALKIIASTPSNIIRTTKRKFNFLDSDEGENEDDEMDEDLEKAVRLSVAEMNNESRVDRSFQKPTSPEDEEAMFAKVIELSKQTAAEEARERKEERGESSGRSTAGNQFFDPNSFASGPSAATRGHPARRPRISPGPEPAREWRPNITKLTKVIGRAGIPSNRFPPGQRVFFKRTFDEQGNRLLPASDSGSGADTKKVAEGGEEEVTTGAAKGKGKEKEKKEVATGDTVGEDESKNENKNKNGDEELDDE